MATIVDGISHVRAWADAAQARLRPAVDPETRQYAPVEQRVETGRAHREILADEQRAVIVVGAHGHGLVEQMFAGSTVQHIARRAGCPVLIVRQRTTREER
jgi:nucleotide-binding universal stress UspA family protein